MSHWCQVLLHWAQEHLRKERARDAERYGYPRSMWGRLKVKRPATVETMEPRLLLTGASADGPDDFWYRVLPDELETAAVYAPASNPEVLETDSRDLAEGGRALDLPGVEDPGVTGRVEDRGLPEVLNDQKPAVDFDDLAVREVGDQGEGAVFFRLNRPGFTGDGAVLFERSVFGPGEAALKATYSKLLSRQKTVEFTLETTDGRTVALGGLLFNGQNAKAADPTLALVWSAESVKLYADGALVRETKAAVADFDASRAKLAGQVLPYAPIQRQKPGDLAGVRFVGAGLSESAVRAMTKRFDAEDARSDLLKGRVAPVSALGVTTNGNATTLSEASDFITEYRYDITVQAGATALGIKYSSLSFDPSATGEVKDAFELSLLDSNGEPVGATIGEGRDAFFNLTEGQAALLASGVGHDEVAGTVGVDVTGLDGQTLTVVARLINNDSDDNTTVTIEQGTAEPGSTHTVLWGVDEDDGHLFAVWDMDDPISTFVDYGVVNVDDGAGGLIPVDSRIESIAVDASGVAYMVANTAVDGVPAPVLLRLDTSALTDPTADVVAESLGTIPVQLDNTYDMITGLSFDPAGGGVATGDLYATFHTDVNNRPDRLMKITVSGTTVTTEDIGLLTSRGANDIVLEAEEGTIESPMQTGSSASAGGGAFVEVAPGNNSESSAPTTGKVSWTFDVAQAGDHHVHARVIAPSSSDDSFWVRMDGGSWVKWNGVTRTTQWKWDKVHDSDDSSNTVVYNLSAGQHTLEIAYREDGAKLDQVLITPDLSADPNSPAYELSQAEDLAFNTSGDLIVSDVDTSKLYQVDPATGEVLGEFDSETIASAEGLAYDPEADDVLAASTSDDKVRAFGLANADRFDLAVFGVTDAEAIAVHQTTMAMPDRATLFMTDEDDGQLAVFWNTSHVDGAYADLGQVLAEDPSNPGNYYALTGIEPIAIDENGTAWFTHLGSVNGTGISPEAKLYTFDLKTLKDGGPIEATFVGEITDGGQNLPSGTTVPGLAFHPTTGELYSLLSESSATADKLVILKPSTGAVQTTVGSITGSGETAKYVQGLTFSADGSTLYITDLNDSATKSDDRVFTVNPSTAAITGTHDGTPFADLPTIQSQTNERLLALDLDPVTGEVHASEPDSESVLGIDSGDGGNSILLDANVAGVTESEGLAYYPQIKPTGSGSSGGGEITPPAIGASSPWPEAPEADYSRGLPFAVMEDVTSAFSVGYTYTGYDANAQRLTVSLNITKTGSQQVRDSLALALRGLVKQDAIGNSSAQLTKYDAFIPLDTDGVMAGTPYIDITSLIAQDADGYFEHQATTQNFVLTFDHVEDAGRFDFELVLLGETNQAPAFTTDPYAAEQGQAYPMVINDSTEPALEILAGQPLVYLPDGVDPDDDAIVISMVEGPGDAGYDPQAGALTWSPTSSDEGLHTFRLRIADEYGLYDPANDQTFTVRVITSSANRLPRFVTDPVTVADAGQTYTYDSDAFDPDGDTLVYAGEVFANNLPESVVDSAVVFYPLDDVSDTSTTVFDASGQGRHAEALSGVADDPGRGAVYFDGTGDGIQLDDADDPGVEDDWVHASFTQRSVSLWFKPDGGITDSQMLFEEGGITAGMAIRLHDGKLKYRVNKNNTGYVANHTLPTDPAWQESWHHVLAVYNAGDMTLYLDGQQVASNTAGPASIPAHGDAAGLGATAGNGNVFQTAADDRYTGWMRSVAIFDAALTSNDLVALREHQLPVTTLGQADGVVTFTPTADHIGETVHVQLYADDGNGGVGEQGYEVVVRNTVRNAPPVFTKLPKTRHVLAGDTSPLAGEVTPNAAIELDLAPGQTQSYQNVSVRIPTSGSSTYVPPVGVANEMIVINENDPAELLAALLGNGAAGIVVNSVTLEAPSVGNPGSPTATTTGIFVNQNDTYGLNEYGIVLSSGNAEVYSDPPSSATGQGSWGVDASSGQQQLISQITNEDGKDASLLEINFDLLPGTDSLFFDVVFGTTEVLANMQFADAFGIFVNGENIALLENPNNPGELLPINRRHPTMVLDNTTGLGGVLTPAGGPVLHFEKFIGDGATGNSLQIIIADSRDSVYDSTAYISSLGGADSEPIDIELVASDGDAMLSVTEVTTQDLLRGELAFFDLTLTGDGQAHAFDLLFRDAADPSRVFGVIPVRIKAAYQSEALAVDPDGEVITYAFVDEQGQETLVLHGAVIDPSTGAIEWDPTVSGTYAFTVQASDDRGGVTRESYTVDVVEDAAGNQDPQVQPVGVISVEAGRELVYQIDGVDPDGDALSYYLVGNVPAGVSLDSESGRLSWVAAPNQVGSHSFSVRVTDGRGGVMDQPVSLVVESGLIANTVPQILSEAGVAALAGGTYRYDVVAVDAEHDRLTYSLVAGPDGMLIDPDEGSLLWEPGTAEKGEHAVVVRVMDELGLSATESYTLTVYRDNLPPTIESLPHGPARVGATYTYAVRAVDLNGDEVRYAVSLAAEADGVSMDPTTGVMTWVPIDSEDTFIEVFAFDSRGGVDRQRFFLPVVDDNAGPRFTSIPVSQVFAGRTLSHQLSADDHEDGVSPATGLVFSVDALGQTLGVSVDPATGVLGWTPSAAGVYTFLVGVADSGGESASQRWIVEVLPDLPGNQQPGLASVPEQPAAVGLPWSFTLEARDSDGDSVTLTLLERPDWVDQTVITSGVGSLQLTGVPDDSALQSFRIRLEDGVNAPIEETFVLPVVDNVGPVLVSAAQSVSIQQSQPTVLHFDVIDPNADGLSIELLTQVSGAALFDQTSVATGSADPDNPTQFKLTFTPDTLGEQALRVRVTDSAGGSIEHTVDLFVYDGTQNLAPTGSMTARTATAAGQEFVAQVDAEDPEQHQLTYGLLAGDGVTIVTEITAATGSHGGGSVPVGMRIDPDTGRITWTPGEDQITPDGVAAYTYVATVSDGINTIVTQPAAELTVYRTFSNGRPDIDSEIRFERASSDPVTLVYQPHATEPDGDPVTWSIAEGPSTVSIDPNSGEVTWRPDGTETDAAQRLVIQATDPYGAFDQQGIDLISSQTIKHAPRIASTPPSELASDGSFVYLIQATDADNQKLRFELIGDLTDSDPDVQLLQEGDSAARLIWSNPSGSVDFEIIVTDPDGLVGRQPVELTVNGATVDQPVRITSTAIRTVQGGDAYAYQVIAVDPDPNSTITYSLTAENLTTPGHTVVGLSIDNNGLVTWADTDTDDYIGEQIQIEITATSGGFVAKHGFPLTVADPVGNSAPVIEGVRVVTAALNTPLVLDVLTSDPDGDDLRFDLVSSAGERVSVIPATATTGEIVITPSGRITWTPMPGEPTPRPLTVRVTDEHGAFDEDVFNLTLGTDAGPSLGLYISDPTPEPGQLLEFRLGADDDGEIVDQWVKLTNVMLFGSEGLTLPVGANGTATYRVPDDQNFVGKEISVTATAVDNTGNSVTSDSQTLIVAGVDLAAPVISLASPTPGAAIEGITDILGRVYDPDGQLTAYSLLLVPQGGAEADSYTLTDQSSGGTPISGVGSPGSDGIIATLNPLALPDGAYNLLLRAEDASGKTVTMSSPVTIASQGVKLGNLSLGFTDLTAPVAGIPLTLQRRYDSLEASESGDFGFGWSLDILSGEIEVDALFDPLDDRINVSGNTGALRYGSQVSIQLPGGEQMSFTAVVEPYLPLSSGFGASGYTSNGFATYSVAFLPNNANSSGAKLEFLGGRGTEYVRLSDPARYGLSVTDDVVLSAQVLINSETNEFLIFSGNVGSELAPTLDPVFQDIQYRLTTRDGSVYDFDSDTGKLSVIKDAYGRQVDFEGGDIIASDSQGEVSRLEIERDSDNRVTRVTNSLGFRVRYEYDTQGNLRTVRQDIGLPANPDDNTNRQRVSLLAYDTDPAFNGASGQAHFLREIKLEDGTLLALTDFTSDGRLSSASSPSGPQQTVVYDDQNQAQTTTTSFGASGDDTSTTSYYDDHGNVTRVVLDDGGLYPGGIEWNYEYDDARFPERLTKQTDPLGRVTTFEYDDIGQLERVNAPGGVATTYEYNNLGQVTLIADESTGRTEYREYNFAGDLLKLWDETGHVYAEWDYDPQGRLLSETDESGTTTYTYDETGRYPTTTTLPNDDTIVSAFDDLGQLTAFTSDGEDSTLSIDGFGRTTQAIYDTQGVNGDPLVVDYGYASDPTAGGDDGLAPDWTTIDSASTGKITRKLSPTGQIEGWVNEDGTETTFEYDNGRLLRETIAIPDGQGGSVEVSKTLYSYDKLGRVSRVTDEILGTYSETTYDQIGRALARTTTDPATGETYTTTYTQDPDLNDYAPGPIRVTDSLDAQTQFNYYLPGTTGNPVAGMGVTEQVQRLDAGLDGLIDTADDTLRTSHVEYNAAGLPVAVVNPDGSRRTIEYRNSDVLGDAAQYPTRVFDEAGRARVFTYSEDGRLESATDLGGNTLEVIYDSDDRIHQVTLPTVPGPGGDQLTVTYGYDTEDQLVSVARPGLGTETIHRFGEAGDPELVELPHGDFVRYSYDDRDDATPNSNTGRITQYEVLTGGTLSTVNGETVLTGGTALESFSYTYAADGQIKAITNDLDSSATTYHYEYERPASENRPGTTRLARVDLPNGTAVAYFYDGMGRVTDVISYTDPADTTGYTTSYEYDSAGRISKVFDPDNPKGQPGSVPTTYTYDLAGRLSERLLPNGVRTRWVFDVRDRVALLEHYDTSTSQVMESFTYWYTADGSVDPSTTVEPRRITRADGSYVSYDYDGSLRLTRELHVDDQGLTVRTIEYSYDGAGNRTGRVVDGVRETYGNDSSSAYLLSSVTGASGTDTFGYDAGGRLKTLTRDGTTQVLSYNGSGRLTAVDSTTYAYDGTGQRIGADDGTTQTSYAVAPSAQSLGVEIGLRYLEVTGSDTSAWVYAGENPIARLNPDGTMSYYLEDAMDSVIGLTDASGATTESYSYDAFGNLLSGSATPDVGYHGAWHDATGLIDMRARAYDPVTGRFTSVDPVEPTPEAYETFHPYAFANQNPLVYSDPTGGFSLIELNVSSLIKGGVRVLQQAGIQHARSEAFDLINKRVFDLVIGHLSALLPMNPAGFNGGPSSIDVINQGLNFESLMQVVVCSALREAGFPEWLYLFPGVNGVANPATGERAGQPYDDGVGCGGDGEVVPGLGGNRPRPDFIFSPMAPMQTENPGDAYLIGDVKRSTQTIYSSYVSPGRQINQFRAITRFSRARAYRVAAFFTMLSTRQTEAALEQLAIREGVANGLIVMIITAR